MCPMYSSFYKFFCLRISLLNNVFQAFVSIARDWTDIGSTYDSLLCYLVQKLVSHQTE
jgi:hypothetical protein